MDIITHGLAGLVAARAVTGQAWGRYGAAALAGALGPDLDLVAGLWDPLAPLTLHRVATHSPLGGLPLAPVAAGLVRPVAGGGFWRLAGVAYLGVLAHIVLDLFTPFGTPLLWPLDAGRWSAGSLYVLDPLVTGILAASLLPSRWWRRPGWQVAQVGLWAWRVEAAGASVFEKERPEAGLLEVANHPAVLRFLAAARFPWRRTVREGDAMTVEYHELAFEDHPFGGPMVLRLRLDPSGAVRAVEWGHRL